MSKLRQHMNVGERKAGKYCSKLGETSIWLWQTLTENYFFVSNNLCHMFQHIFILKDRGMGCA